MSATVAPPPLPSPPPLPAPPPLPPVTHAAPPPLPSPPPLPGADTNALAMLRVGNGENPEGPKQKAPRGRKGALTGDFPPPANPVPKVETLGRPKDPDHVRVHENGTEYWWIPEASRWVQQVGTGNPAPASAPASAAEPDADALNIPAAVSRYLALRDEKAAMEKRHSEEKRPLNDEMDALEGRLLNALTGAGLKNMATENGTVLLATESSATIADAGAFQRFVIDNQQWNLLDWRANKTAVRQFIQDNKTNPPGVNFRAEVVAQVRRKSGTG